MGKGGCGRSASNLSAAQTMRAATTSLRGGTLVSSRGRLGAAAPSSGSTASSGAGGAGGADGTTGHASATSESSAAAQLSDNGDWLDWIDQDKYEPRPNAQPGAWLPVMRLRGPSDARDSEQQHVVLQTMKWGLYPHYKKEPPGPGAHFQMFNARSEDGVKSQKRLVGRKQCVIISAGFYEFKEVAGRAPGVFTGPKTHKQGYYVHLKGSSTPMYFAGLYDTWRQQDDPEATPLYTCTILTTEPSEKLRWLHNRMPVILDTNQKVQQWLSATVDDVASITALSKLYVGCDSSELAWYPVTRELNSARYQGPDCTTELSLESKNAMQKFFKPARPRTGAQEQDGKAAVPEQETVAKQPKSAARSAAGDDDLTASTKSPRSASPTFGGVNVGSSAIQLMLRPCGQPLCSAAAPVSVAIPTLPMSAPDDDATTSKNWKYPSDFPETTYLFAAQIDMMWTPFDLARAR